MKCFCGGGVLGGGGRGGDSGCQSLKFNFMSVCVNYESFWHIWYRFIVQGFSHGVRV